MALKNISHLLLAGKQILTHYQDADATEAFYSLHSEKAVKMLKLMRPMERKEVPPVSSDFDKGASPSPDPSFLTFQIVCGGLLPESLPSRCTPNPPVNPWTQIPL